MRADFGGRRAHFPDLSRRSLPAAIAAGLFCLAAAPAFARSGNAGRPLRALTAPARIDGGRAARFRAAEDQAAYARAAGLALAGKPGEALSLLEPISSRSPEDLAVRDALGAVYCDLKDPQKAEAQFDFVMERRPEAAWNWYRGRTLIDLGDLDGARRALELSLTDGPDKNFGQDIGAAARAKIAALDAQVAATNRSAAKVAAGDLAGAVAEAEAAVAALETDSAKARLSQLRGKLESERKAARARMITFAGSAAAALVLALIASFWRAEVLRGRESAPSPGDPVSSGTEGELMDALMGGRAGAVAGEYVAAGKSAALLEALTPVCSRDPRAAPVYARAFLLAGDYDSAYELWKHGAPSAEDRRVFAVIDRVVRLRRGVSLFVGQESYGERLSLANSFSGLGLHEEALGVLNEAAVDVAGRDEMDAVAVAEHFSRAGKASLLVERAALKARRPEFYTNFAGALRVWGMNEAGLGLLMKKQAVGWEDPDFTLLVEFHRSLGTLESLDPALLPEPRRVLLAEGLLDAGTPERALDVLAGLAKRGWRAREYLAGMRSLGKLDRYPQAAALYDEAEPIAPVGVAPEVHYYFAVLCERAGNFERAKTVYRAILAARAGYKDVAERLRNVEAIPAEETGRVTTMLASAVKLGLAGADAAAFLKSLEERERSGVLGERLVFLSPAGVGGMGVVYKARDLKTGRDVAVKRLRGELAANPAMRREIVAEGKALSALSHPNIVSYYESVEAGDVTYLVFEFVDGETLHEIVAARGRLPAREAVNLLGQACAALAHAHEKGIVHRDVKPGNIMLARGGRVKVMDFGLARHSTDGAALETGSAGTPAYMPPEQYDGKASFAGDVYSLGATAYELVAGRLPFAGADIRGLKSRESFEGLPADVPKKLAELIAACLKADPAARPAGIVQVGVALAAVFEARE